jgi:hypothetical protein
LVLITSRLSTWSRERSLLNKLQIPTHLPILLIPLSWISISLRETNPLRDKSRMISCDMIWP